MTEALIWSLTHSVSTDTISAAYNTPPTQKGRPFGRPFVFAPREAYAWRSNRSAFMTFTQAATKSLTNFCLLSDWA